MIFSRPQLFPKRYWGEIRIPGESDILFEADRAELYTLLVDVKKVRQQASRQ
jgi:hypothetical protein